jgi:hypothetical protein
VASGSVGAGVTADATLAAVLRHVWTVDVLLDGMPEDTVATHDVDVPGRVWLRTGNNVTVYELAPTRLRSLYRGELVATIDREVAHFRDLHWQGSVLNVWPGWRT